MHRRLFGSLFLVVFLFLFVFGCSTVHKMVSDYNVGSKSSDMQLVNRASSVAGDFASGVISVAIPDHQGMAKYFGSLVSFVVSVVGGYFLGVRKRKTQEKDSEV